MIKVALPGNTNFFLLCVLEKVSTSFSELVI